MDWSSILSPVGWQRAVTTFVLVVALVVGRQLIVRSIGRTRLPNDIRRRWIVRTRAALFFAIVAAVLVVWGTELRSFAVSIVAFAVAVVVAGKELILCVTGTILRTASQSFAVGDRIQVGGIRGYVIDHNLLTTNMLEIGPGKTGQMQTGNLVAIPNSLYFSGPVVNETFMEEYMLHVFTVPMKLSQNWRQAQLRLLQIATDECAVFTQEAENHVAALERKHGLNLPSVDPRVSIQLPEPERVDLAVRIPVKASQRGAVEQKILVRFLEEHSTHNAS